MPEDDNTPPAQRDVHAERLSPAAAHRGHRTIAVSDVFAAHADEIAAAVAHLQIRHVLVAVVDAEHEFAGTHEVPETNLIERVKELEFPDGWAMVFSPGASAEHVRTRTTEMAALARKRIAAIERINARRA
jgi:hypothetical protein